MPKRYATLLIGWLLCPLLCNPSLAQVSGQVLPFACGTKDLTPAQTQALQQQTMLALKRKMGARKAFTSITYVPIRPHIIRRSDGTDGLDIGSLNKIMAATNSYYLVNGLGIQFYFAGTTPDYMDDNAFFDAYTPDESGLVTNALNQYYAPHFSPGLFGISGLAFYPYDVPGNTCSYILTGNQNDNELGNRVVPHELGHTFGLIHTFGQIPGNGPAGSGITHELVTRGAGANCATEGDLLCDTPADPFNMPGATLAYVNGCLQYDPNSTARDANGDPYSPLISNIMSYYVGTCTHDFTQGQYDRIQAGLALRQTHTTYSLDFPATDVVPISNLAASSNGVSVLLTWQDNAHNEMGYFIERSTSPTANFRPIGGVGPNVTSYRDNQTIPQTQYYYRIRPSNTTTGSISSTASIIAPTVPPVTGLTTTDITGHSARLNWNSLGEGAIYDVQWRPVGAANWTIINGITELYTVLTLLAYTTYEWQVRGQGSESYSGPVNFTTPCPKPTDLASNPARASASLSWMGISNQTYTLQWRTTGSANWTTVSDITSANTHFGTTAYILTGLTSQTNYEWQLQGVCPGSPVVSSGYTNPQSFTTGVCNPATANTSLIGAASATFFWFTSYSEPGSSAEIRYRPVGTTNWNMISGLTGSPYTLTGLTNNTTYEWQLKNICGATESSAYTSLSTFTTSCQIPGGLLNATTSKTAVLRWSVTASPYPGTTYTVQYRSVGAPNWTTVSSLTASTYSLTGLNPGTTYEWHVLTACLANAQSNYSSTKTFTPACNQPTINNLRNLLVTSSSAQLVWTVQNDPDTRYTIRYRPVSAASWNEIGNLTGSSTGGFSNLTNLTNNTTYEWQISTLCSDTQTGSFVSGPTFTTQCPSPILLSSIAQISTASLSWSRMGINVTYEVNYRRFGEDNWTIINNLTANTLLISGLTGGSMYEWRVETNCSDGQSSDFPTTQAYFTTYSSCNSPIPNAQATNLTTNSATVNWNYSFGDSTTRYEVRYRVVGSVYWTTISGITTTTSSLTGLTNTTQYEWQVRTICSPTEISVFSTSYTFQTLAPCSSMYTIQTGAWNDPAIWSCNRIPMNTDSLQIKHIVIIPASYIATAYRVSFENGQKLSYGTNAQLRLGF